MAISSEKSKKFAARVTEQLKGSEKKLRPESYKMDLINSLNYYNSNHEDKQKKAWYIHHLAKTDKQLSIKMSILDDYHFRYVGILARLIDGGSVLQRPEEEYFTKQSKLLLTLLGKQNGNVEQTKPAVTITIQDRIDLITKKHISEFEGVIDEILINKTISDFSAKSYFISNEITTQVTKRIAEHFGRYKSEFEESYRGKDEQLTEGYSCYTRSQMRAIIDFINSIITTCEGKVTDRKPRKRKVIPASRIIANVKYMKEFVELGLKSINPISIIGSSEVWVYNTKYRRISIYKCAEGQTISVKGTTLIGVDLERSLQYMLRKPEIFFKNLIIGKRALSNTIKTLTTKPAMPNGRINVESIILGVF